MRPSPLLLATAATVLVAGSALAAAEKSSTPPSASSSPPTSDSSAASPSAKTGTSADTSATAGGFAAGMPVKDNTGATIGSIASLTTDSSGKPEAVIKMGSDQFQVETAKLNQSGGAAVINLSKAEITSMLHKSTASSAAPDSAAGGTGPGAPKP